MKTESFSFKARDGKEVFVSKWTNENEAKPKAAVQIAHGMAEHVLRYEDFAKALVEEGYAVYGNDHRGHGRTAGSLENIGYLSDSNGWNLMIEDMKELTNIIEDENPGIPVFLFGHSMGSLLSRAYIQSYGNGLDGVILCGTGGDPGFMGKVGIFLVKREIKQKGKKARSKRMNNLMFGAFNKKFKPNRTDFDWLNRDEIEVDRYIEDPLCGGVFTTGFFYDLLTGVMNLNKSENIEKTPKDLPMYIISGEKDPVGNSTKGILQVYNSYREVGLKDITYKFYKDARHEILNEINKEEVYEDVVYWIGQRC